MPGSVPIIPDDVLKVIRRAFAAANRTTSERMCRLPNVWETSLDQAFIDTLVGQGGPIQVDSGWTVRIETHFLGGGRHWGPEWDFPRRRWEIADLGVLVMIRDGSRLVLTKLALFQSKRLYPVDQPIDEIEIDHYISGFYRLYEGDAIAAEASKPRLFKFATDSTYNMILAGDQQIDRIAGFERNNRVPVHYLLYNPAVLPWSQAHPLSSNVALPLETTVGCRVVPATNMRQVMVGARGGSSPSYGQLIERLPSPFRGPRTRAGRRIEDFIERLVTCKEGYRAESRQDNALNYVFGGRGAPIAAAIGLTISAPDSG
jgi:hypothetical protein